MDGIADYRFVRQLGDAGYGAMYLATAPPRLNVETEYVGVKVLQGVDDEAALRRATRELRAFAAVRSPFLVKLLDAGRDGSSFFYAMEFCEGGSLAHPSRPLGEDEVLRIVQQAALAAHALHEAGMVHRGIKPANVLLHKDGARLADLGLVQALDPAQSVTGLGGVGTVEYIEPLLLTGHPATRASDIWSLGATLHRALTGEGVFGELAADDPLMSVRVVLSAQPRISDELPRHVSDLIRQCLAPDRDARPPTAQAFADALAPVARATPPPAEPHTPGG
jgi:serine/threonine protein kinase